MASWAVQCASRGGECWKFREVLHNARRCGAGRSRMKALLAVLATFVFITSTGSAQTNPTTSAVTAPDPTAAINQLRTELVDAFNKGDVDRMLLHLDDEIIVTWQNGEV